MEFGLQPGLTANVSFEVKSEHLAPALGSGDARVFSTPMLVAGIEAAACAITRPRLPRTLTTVGTHVDIRHKAATPLGMLVTFEATLVEISANGKGLSFSVSARDEAGEICEGRHERVIVDWRKFEAKTAARKKDA